MTKKSILLISLAVAAAAIGAYFLIRKKQENEILDEVQDAGILNAELDVATRALNKALRANGSLGTVSPSWVKDQIRGWENWVLGLPDEKREIWFKKDAGRYLKSGDTPGEYKTRVLMWQVLKDPKNHNNLGELKNKWKKVYGDWAKFYTTLNR